MLWSKKNNFAGYVLVLGIFLQLGSCKQQYRDTPECPNPNSDRGPLVIKSGATVTLDAGKQYYYSSIMIYRGGVLQFTGSTPQWTVLRSRGDFILAGTIRSVGFKLRKISSKNDSIAGAMSIDSIKRIMTKSKGRLELTLRRIKRIKTTPQLRRSRADSLIRYKSDSAKFTDSLTSDTAFVKRTYVKIIKHHKLGPKLSQDSTVWKYGTHFKETDSVSLKADYGKLNNGGQGGAGGRVNECHPKSCFKLSCNLGSDGSPGVGGKGGIGMSYYQRVQCENAGYNCDHCYLSVNAPNKSSETGFENCSCYTSDNGGWTGLSPGLGQKGGDFGSFGGLLYLVTCSNFIGDHGTVDISGGSGGNGTDGQSNRYSGGGGGGGGPGGNGGTVYFNVKGNLSAPNVKMDGGTGGKGGKGGTPHALDGLAGLKGEDGKPGQQGARGNSYVCQGNCLLNSKEQKPKVSLFNFWW